MRIAALFSTVAFACLLGVAHAEKIDISGTHSSGDIKKTCGEAGGDFWEVGGSYGCVNECKKPDGGLGLCGVSCTSGKCTGTVPDRKVPGSEIRGLLKGQVAADINRQRDDANQKPMPLTR